MFSYLNKKLFKIMFEHNLQREPTQIIFQY